jgi:hypothetical protein
VVSGRKVGTQAQQYDRGRCASRLWVPSSKRDLEGYVKARARVEVKM